MKDTKQIKRKQIQFRAVSHVHQLGLEVEEARWQINDLHERHMISSDKHARIIEHIDKIDDNVKAAATVVHSIQEKLL